MMKSPTANRCRTKAGISNAFLGLPAMAGMVVSPYFGTHKNSERAGRINQIILEIMSRKAIATLIDINGTGANITVHVGYTNTAGTTIEDPEQLDVAVAGLATADAFKAAAETAILSYSTSQSYGLVSSDIIWLGLNTTPVASPTLNNAPGRSIVTGTGATGFQVSSTKNSRVQYSPTMVTTASISGNASDVIVFEIAPTNSATAGDWVEISRLTNAQALTLAITLQSVQTTSGLIGGKVPAGYYAKIRAITSGTVTNSLVSAQEEVGVN